MIEYVCANSEYGELSLKEEFSKTFIFHVRRYYTSIKSWRKSGEEYKRYIYFLVNPSEELAELSKQQVQPGDALGRNYLSDLSPSEIKGMFSSMGSMWGEKSIPASIEKLLNEREWEFDCDWLKEDAKEYANKEVPGNWNQGYIYKKITIHFKNTYLVIPSVTFVITPIGNSKTCSILEVTKKYVVFLITDTCMNNEDLFTWHINGPKVYSN